MPIVNKPEDPRAADPDCHCLARIRAGDTAALGEIYDRHGALLYGLIVRIVGVTRAEDTLQDVLMRVWTGVDVYDSALGSPRAWLIGLARYRALDHLRNDRAGAGRGQAHITRDLSRDVLPFVSQVFANEDQGRIGAILESLPAEQRHLIEYAFFGGFSVTELATHFQRPVEQIREGLRDGMLLLKDRLPYGEGGSA